MALQLIIAGNDKPSKGYVFYYLKKSGYRLYKKRNFRGNIFMYLSETKNWMEKTTEFKNRFRDPEAIYFFNRKNKHRYPIDFFNDYKIETQMIDVTDYSQKNVEDSISVYIDAFVDNKKVVILKNFNFRDGIPYDINFLIDIRTWGIRKAGKKQQHYSLFLVNNFLKQQQKGFPIVIGIGTNGNNGSNGEFSDWLSKKINHNYDTHTITIK